MKCDMCYDRTSVGRRPMCATVCPSQALAYVKPEAMRGRRERPTNVFVFGNQTVTTQLFMMAPAEAIRIDVADYMVKSYFTREPAYPVQVVARVGELPVGGVKLFAYPAADDPCILVRTAPDSYAACSQKCTHLSCAVYYSREGNRLECPCHQGAFSVTDGQVLQGPPPRPLPRVVLERREEELVAIGVTLKAEA
jgi:Rieske Fe-S protein